MKNFILFFLILPCLSRADWYCEKVASERQGNIINSCGIGSSTSEDEARKDALRNAYKELDLICANSVDCENFELSINPLRTECHKESDQYICHRGIQAKITDTPRDKEVPRNYNAGELLVPIKKTFVQEDLVEVNRGLVSFETNPPEARVYVDGVELCLTPCSKEIQYGQHRLEIKKNNFDSLNNKFKVTKSQHNFSYNLDSTYGQIRLENLPSDAEVKIDDLAVSTETISLSPGEHVITVDSKSYQPFHQKFKLKKGETKIINCTSAQLFGFADISVHDEKNNDVKAEIYVDGELVGDSPKKVKILVGARRLSAKLGQYEGEQTILMALNEKKSIVIQLILKTPQANALRNQRYGGAGCGLGSMLFTDKEPVFQILASTTNNTYSNQTFGISSGTSNCDPPPRKKEITEAFIETNRIATSNDIAKGAGETIIALSKTYGCPDSAKVAHVLQKSYKFIFQPGHDNAKEIVDHLEYVMENNFKTVCTAWNGLAND